MTSLVLCSSLARIKLRIKVWGQSRYILPTDFPGGNDSANEERSTSLLDTQYHNARYYSDMIIPQNSCNINDYHAVSMIIMHYQGETSYVDAERRRCIQVDLLILPNTSIFGVCSGFWCLRRPFLS